MLTTIKNPWVNEFKSLLRNAEKEVLLASPFIKYDIAGLIADLVKPSVKARYLNSFKLTNFYQRSSDLSALKLLLEKGISVKSHHRLHAKMFIFDAKRAVVTSSNLTNGGLKNNFEYGLLIEDASVVESIRHDYFALYSDKDLSNNVTHGIIQTAENIISSVPKEKKPKALLTKETKLFKQIDNDYLTAEKFEGGLNAIETNLSGWVRDVFLILNEFDDDIFDLNQAYKFEKALEQLHPRNKNIKPKIRQQLQYLRNHGLLEFLGNGRYKKLWSKED
jgi:phosphatidylserine/phosphatidylglycerophosphate/cardiolipin synthase-like enzyme